MTAPQRRRTYTSARHRLYTYGLTDEGYRQLLEQQGGRCPVCGLRSDRLVVDHDHETGAVRGLLCDRCNRAIGHLQDSPGICRRAGEYLRRSVQPSDGTG